MRIVIDASALIDAFLGDVAADAAIAGHELQAPVTIDAEMLHGLRRQWLAKKLTDAEVDAIILLFRDIPITRHSIQVQNLFERMWSLRRNITAYDAAYVALAESLDIPLLTRDWRLAHSSGHTARIQYIA
jgi:predicted nucleic acid-binding protein